MKFTNISKFIIKFMGGGKINFPFNYLKEVEINGDNDGEGGGGEDSEGFDLDTFKQNIVDIYNKTADTPITTDNIIMPDAFVMGEPVSSDEQQGTTYHVVDADLMKFLSSACISSFNVIPIYLKDSLNENNVYFGSSRSGYILVHHDGFNSEMNVGGIINGEYTGNLDLSNYIILSSAGNIS